MEILKNNIIVVCICGQDEKDKNQLAEDLERLDKKIYREKATMVWVPSFVNRRLQVGETQCKEHISLSEMPEYEAGEVFVHEKNEYDEWFTETQVRKFRRPICVTSEKSILVLKAKNEIYKAILDHSPTPPFVGQYRWAWSFKVFSVWVGRQQEEPSLTTHDLVVYSDSEDYNKTIDALHTRIMRMKI